MAQTLSKNGYNVRVLAWKRTRYSIGLSADKAEFSYFRLPSSYGWKAAIRIIPWQLYCIGWLLTHNLDVVQPQNLDNLIPVLAVRIVKRFRIVYDLADFYSDNVFPNLRPVVGPVARFERMALTHVDGLILVSERQLLQTGSSYLPTNLTTIYNAPSNAEIEKMTGESAQERVASKNILLSYSGGLARERYGALVRLSKAIKGLDGVVLEIAAFGDMLEPLRSIVTGSKNTRCLGTISREEVIARTRNSDCVVIPYDAVYRNVRVALPGKLFDAMSLSKPVLVPKGTYMAEFVEKLGIGYATDFAKEDAIKETCESMLNDRSALSHMGQRGKAAFDKSFTESAQTRRLLDLYAHL